MTLNEAIKIQREQLAIDNPQLGTAHRASVLMSIDALKKIKSWRTLFPNPHATILKGETPEETTGRMSGFPYRP